MLTFIFIRNQFRKHTYFVQKVKRPLISTFYVKNLNCIFSSHSSSNINSPKPTLSNHFNIRKIVFSKNPWPINLSFLTFTTFNRIVWTWNGILFQYFIYITLFFFAWKKKYLISQCFIKSSDFLSQRHIFLFHINIFLFFDF